VARRIPDDVLDEIAAVLVAEAERIEREQSDSTAKEGAA
jgi:hypothetical protein